MLLIIEFSTLSQLLTIIFSGRAYLSQENKNVTSIRF